MKYNLIFLLLDVGLLFGYGFVLGWFTSAPSFLNRKHNDK